jgi:plastocyanin
MKRFYNVFFVLTIPALFAVIKKAKYSRLAITFLLCSVIFVNSQATIWTVDVQNFTFNPTTLPDVKVGDTVRWIWVNGSHTTTSTTIPDGADNWDEPINIELQQYDYIPTVTGTYNYKCTPHAPNMVGSFTVSSAVGIADEQSSQEFKIYPNPSTGLVYIQSPATNNETSVKIVNLHGQLILEKYLSEKITPIELSNVQKGIYFAIYGKQTERLIIH